MFIQPQEMTTVIAQYRLFEIIDNDETILHSCIVAAIKRVRSYLNNRYDTHIIFSQTEDHRDPEILEICKNITLWFLCRRYNVDILYTRVKETYDRDIAYLKTLADGTLAAELPLRTTDGNPVSSIRHGSNTKFKHTF